MNKKITVIGGGSSTFTPQLMRLFVESEVLRGSTITLMDIDTHRLETMDRLCNLLVENEQADLTIESTTDQRESLVGADFVITTISVGGMDAWEKDIEIPAKYGIYMTIADSVGPGGIMRALRHIPVLASVVADVGEVAPDAWVFNYTNPVTSIITALRRHRPDVKSVGLCSCPSITRNPRYLSDWAGVEPDEVALPAPAAGLNHCAFMTDVRLVDGRSALPLILERTRFPVIRWTLETYGVLPYCWSHVTEFFPALSQLVEPYQGKLQGLEMAYGLHVHDMDHERARGEKWERLVETWSSSKGEDAIGLDVLPGGEAIEVVQIIEALLTNRHGLFGVNVPNRGAIDNLPDDAVVEVTSLVDSYGIRPTHVGALPEPLAATLRSHITAQQLTAEAALTGDHKAALQAFIHDPQTQARLGLDDVRNLVQELFAAHRQHLPQFS
jgi:alpha-galactosidase